MSEEKTDKVINKDTGETVTEEKAEDVSELEEAVEEAAEDAEAEEIEITEEAEDSGKEKSEEGTGKKSWSEKRPRRKPRKPIRKKKP